MRLLWRALSLILTIWLILIAHIFVVNFLPFPFNSINITFSLLLLFLTVSQNKKIIWLGLITSYFLELFSGSPFGIGMAATIISLLVINWFQLNILTNRSGYIVLLSLLLGIALYRILFVAFLVVSRYFFHQESLSYKQVIVDAGWEVLLSSVLLFLLQLIGSKFIKRFNSTRTKTGIIYG
ncbi:MAG: hypothetical protein G01um101413_218 [Parcubacteria group bacterium Gr01-1014_13]|nr:MAG: hypothetical protein G01um101413_218 [Parcubacteria group bacterium Gr01-1014_13]